MSRGIPDFLSWSCLAAAKLPHSCPPCCWTEGMKLDLQDSPSMSVLEPFCRKVREGSTGLGEQGFTCQLSQAAPVVGRHSAVPHGLGRAITDAFRAFPSLCPMHSPSNCWVLTIVRGPHPRAGPLPALQPPQGAGQGPWHWQMSDNSRLLLSG